MPSDADIWAHIRRELRADVTDSVYHLWLEPLTLEAIDDDELLLGAPDSIRSWVADRFGRLLETTASAVLDRPVSIAVVPVGDGAQQRSRAPERRSTATPEPGASDRLNPKYTFEQFVIGDGNRLAHAAALSVAELPGQAYNPLFIYGPPGLGKTHLLHAIGNYLTLNEPQLRVRYSTVEAFTSRFVDALGNRRLPEFKSLYRDADILLIDDVQFLASKARTEEEFFHTFNSLYETGAQLVLTADRVPADLDAVEDRLRERFESGLVTDIRSPDLDTRLTILRMRAERDGLGDVDNEALHAIATRITTNIRTLEGALIRVVAFHSLTRRPLDAALVDEVLDTLYPASRRPDRRSVRDVQQAACEFFGVTLEELRSPSRAGRLAWPRQVAMYLARELTDASLPAIGREFGGRNHATVLHAWRRTGERIADDRDAYEAVRRLTELLRSTG